MKLSELNKIISEQYDNLIQEGLDWSVENDENEHVYFVNHAYEFAHYNEIQAFFDNMEEEEYENDWEDIVSQCNKPNRILKGIYENWLDYTHPEYYNFFCYEDLREIIKNWFMGIGRN